MGDLNNLACSCFDNLQCDINRKIIRSSASAVWLWLFLAISCVAAVGVTFYTLVRIAQVHTVPVVDVHKELQAIQQTLEKDQEQRAKFDNTRSQVELFQSYLKQKQRD